MSGKVLKASCEQIGFVESLIKSTGAASLSTRGDSEVLWRVQRDFEPIITIRTWEVLTRGFFPIRVTFEYNNKDNRASISVKRKGLERLKQILPEVFEGISENDGEEELKYEKHQEVIQPTEPAAARDSI